MDATKTASSTFNQPMCSLRLPIQGGGRHPVYFASEEQIASQAREDWELKLWAKELKVHSSIPQLEAYISATFNPVCIRDLFFKFYAQKCAREHNELDISFIPTAKGLAKMQVDLLMDFHNPIECAVKSLTEMRNRWIRNTAKTLGKPPLPKRLIVEALKARKHAVDLMQGIFYINCRPSFMRLRRQYL
jgi:hypothetical protein